MTRKYFGTDGIRGVANEFLTADLALTLGRAAMAVLPSERPVILVGRDTRISGGMLEAALVAGLSSAGGLVVQAGVIPTPAIAGLVVAEGADAGAVISASHNPYQDNGIKFFGSTGFKLTDEQELEMERFLTGESVAEISGDPGRIGALSEATEAYVDGLLERFDLDLSRFRIVLDCANGATYRSSPMAFRRLGADITVINDSPDGYNINDNCGSTHMEQLQGMVRDGEYDLGFAYDGDGDRVLAVDSGGALVDGDFIMAICANYLKDQGRLPADTIVTTVMTNLGFHTAMKQLGIAVKTTAVGDRYVLEEMLSGGFGFGGEQSGHLINLETGTTGDGLATSLLLLEVMDSTGASLSELAKVMTRLPQKLVNVRVKNLAGLEDAAAVWAAIEEEQGLLGDSGRILVRTSGTEPLVRVMVEAPSEELCAGVCDRIVAEVERSLGAA
ncbi:MAG: phosphoglucosamine mutase [Actinobacteria bacterium]|nr:phosphoglucosamine mutase [Actinomycetota bacterium]